MTTRPSSSLQMVLMVLVISTAVSFGFWQNSYFAGLFMFMILLLFVKDE